MKRPDVNRPLIFAHRGANQVCPENTLPAFVAAVDLAPMASSWTCSTARMAVGHLPRLQPGQNHATARARVASRTLRRLQSWMPAVGSGPQFAATCIPILDQVLDLLKGKLLINIELKSLDMRSTLGHDVVRLRPGARDG